MKDPFPRHGTFLSTTALVWLLAIFLPGCGEDSGAPADTGYGHRGSVFADVDKWYVDERWSANAAYFGGAAIARHSTAVWLRRIGDIEPVDAGAIPDIAHLSDGSVPDEGFGLREHLQAAEAQGNALLQLVLFNLPGRACAIEPTAGELPAAELPPGEAGMHAYRAHYVDRLVRILRDFPHIPVAAIIEPHSLPHLAIGRNLQRCGEVGNQYAHGYVNGVRYAVNRLAELGNVHIYLDAGAADLFGWDDDLALASLFIHGTLIGFDETTSELDQLLAEPGGERRLDPGLAEAFAEPPNADLEYANPPGYTSIDGFVTNVAGYVPLHEPYLGEPRASDSGAPLMSAPFYDWNPRFDEWTYSADWLASLAHYGADTDRMGMLIDTSRNGWGQASRPAATAATQDPAAVDDLRLDRRLHRGNWCNQPGGLGSRPQARPDGKAWIDAYVWIKPPGESDGPAEALSDNNEPGYLSNPWCVPGNVIARTSAQTGMSDAVETGALPNGPFVSRWHTTGFATLLENAWPRICDGNYDVCD